MECLEATVNLILAGNGGPAIRDALDEMLASKLSVSSRAVRGNRRRTIRGYDWTRPPRDLGAAFPLLGAQSGSNDAS